jgi:hypothetical protein
MNFFNCPLECGSIIKNIFHHIHKCRRKNLLGSEYLRCETDFSHIIKKDEYINHLQICEKSNYKINYIINNKILNSHLKG